MVYFLGFGEQANNVSAVFVLRRYANVVPLPETRVHLKRINEDERTEYINANFVKVSYNDLLIESFEECDIFCCF